MMRRFPTLTAVASATMLFTACPDDDNDKPDTTDTTDVTPDTGDTTPDVGPDVQPDTTDGDTTPTIPTPPALGTQIDRIGRPAVSTALIAPFQSNATTKGALKDEYNAAAPAAWSGYAAEMSSNLAIYDALDGVCGNQLAAGATATAGRYGTLGAVLSDDRLWVNTASTTCTTYLAVEANATGILANTDCGGRRFGYDVIDITYSAVAIGALAGVGDGITADDGMPAATFPFLAAPGPEGFPSAPALSPTQIDRIGRPAVSTALIGTFDGNATTKGELKDEYNAAQPATWATYAPEMAGNLAIYDALDGVCGNQLAAGATLNAERYGVLASVLANDLIWVNTASSTCTTYLAVEANATGILANTDCGGRRFGYDVVDTTYSALAVGAFAGVTDGISADDGTPGATFPFLAAPPVP